MAVSNSYEGLFVFPLIYPSVVWPNFVSNSCGHIAAPLPSVANFKSSRLCQACDFCYADECHQFKITLHFHHQTPSEGRMDGRDGLVFVFFSIWFLGFDVLFIILPAWRIYDLRRSMSGIARKKADPEFFRSYDEWGRKARHCCTALLS